MPSKGCPDPLSPPIYLPGATSQVTLSSATAFTNYTAPTTTAGLGARFVRVESRDNALLLRIGTTSDGATFDWHGFDGIGVSGCLMVPANGVGIFRIPDRSNASDNSRGAIGICGLSGSATAMFHWGS